MGFVLPFGENANDRSHRFRSDSEYHASTGLSIAVLATLFLALVGLMYGSDHDIENLSWASEPGCDMRPKGARHLRRDGAGLELWPIAFLCPLYLIHYSR